MNAVIYARFSSDRQSEASIDAQVRACIEYAEKKHILISHVYKDEAVSGTTANRAEYQQMLSDAFDGAFDTILIHKYDRIARSLSEQVSLAGKLKALNIRLIAVAQDYGEGKDAQLSKGIQWVLGEYYSANLSEETKKGHKETALKALHNGGYAPFGYDVVDQKYIINEEEAAYVRRMFDACILGTGYKNIIADLKKAGLKGKRGAEIKYPQIYEILKNEKYTGTYLYKLDGDAIRIDDALPAIIDRQTYERVKNIMKAREIVGRKTHRLSGLVYCECGKKMYFYHSENKKGSYEYFRCQNKCGAKGIRADKLDEMVNEYMALLFSEKNIAEVEDAILKLSKSSNERKKEFEKKKKADLAKAKKELDEVTKALASGAFKNNYDYCEQLLSEKRRAVEEIARRSMDEMPESKIRGWLDSIIRSDYSPRAFIDRIEVKTNEVKIISTFASFVENIGCGGRINIIPRILFSFYSRFRNTTTVTPLSVSMLCR